MVQKCKLRGIIFEQEVGFYERIAPSRVIFSEGFAFSHLKRPLKRWVDICLSALLLVLSLPLLLLSAIIIKLESRRARSFTDRKGLGSTVLPFA